MVHERRCQAAGITGDYPMIAVRKRNAVILRSDSGAPYVTLATRLHTKGNSRLVRTLFFAALVSRLYSVRVVRGRSQQSRPLR